MLVNGKTFSSVWFALLICIFSFPTLGQDLPKTIRGYKVHNEILKISATKTADPNAPVRVDLGDPTVEDVSLTGITLLLTADLLSNKQSGKVDFLMFRDVQVNGTGVEIDEYTKKFEFKRTELVSLPEPARIFIPTTGIMQAAWREMRESREIWTVKGRVFVFGKFKKLGMHHKRVVPFDFEYAFPNPLWKKQTATPTT
jgi:hypothetical protein